MTVHFNGNSEFPSAWCREEWMIMVIIQWILPRQKRENMLLECTLLITKSFRRLRWDLSRVRFWIQGINRTKSRVIHSNSQASRIFLHMGSSFARQTMVSSLYYKLKPEGWVRPRLEGYFQSRMHSACSQRNRSHVSEERSKGAASSRVRTIGMVVLLLRFEGESLLNVDANDLSYDTIP